MILPTFLALTSIASWHELWSVPYNGAYFNDPAIIASNGSFAVYGPSGAFRADSKARRLVPYKDGQFVSQVDCGRDLVTVETPTRPLDKFDWRANQRIPWSIRTYRLSDGALMSTITTLAGQAGRVGNILTAQRQGVHMDYYDALTGRQLEDVPGGVFWDSNHIRLITRKNPSPQAGDTFLLCKCRPNSFDAANTVVVGEYAQGLDHFLGDPGKGPFALLFSFVGAGVEAYSSSAVRSDFTRLPNEPPLIRDAGPAGFIGSGPHKYPGTPASEEISVLDPVTGKVRWKRSLPQEVLWLGDMVRASTPRGTVWSLYDGRTGQPRGTLKLPGELVGSRGDIFIFRKGHSLTEYRLDIRHEA